MNPLSGTIFLRERLAERASGWRLFAKAASILLSLLALTPAVAVAQVNVWTQHNDNARTGANLSETVLNTSNVNPSQFGKLFAYTVDAAVFAQPLVISNVTIPSKGPRNVVFVATMNNSVYAFDADDANTDSGQPIWKVNFNNPSAGITPVPSADISTNRNYAGPYGIMGTPVIDQASATIYLVARTKENGVYFQRLHALDITTGQERPGSPVTITATVTNADGTTAAFNPKMQNQRPALALANTRVYISWASAEDLTPYQGWVIGYNAATLVREAIFNSAPKGSMAGIWMSGQGPSVDANGNLYLSTGNGDWDGNVNFGQSVLKLSPSLAVLDWFTPDNWSATNAVDFDVGSSGVLLIPGTQSVVAGSKEGKLYLLNTANMGHLAAGNAQIPQFFQASTGEHIHSGPVYWNGPAGRFVYLWAEEDYLKAFRFTGSVFDTTPATQTTFKAPAGMPSGFLSLSANGSVGGTGIIWGALPLSGDASLAVVPGVLRAFDATDLSREIWNSETECRDSVGFLAKFVAPTVANGKVYLPTFSNQLLVYGLLTTPPTSAGKLDGSVACNSDAVNLTAVGTSDWAKWPNYVHKLTGGTQISNYAAIGSGAGTYPNDPRTLTWSDGTPTASGSDQAGVSIQGIGSGFRISAPATTTERTLRVYVGGWNSGGKLVAHLSDGSSPDYVDGSPTSTGQYDVVYTLTYRAASAGQQLVVTWTQVYGAGNVTLQGAAMVGNAAVLAANVAAPAVPTGVSASDGTSTTSVTVTWTPSPNATGYTVYRSTTRQSTLFDRGGGLIYDSVLNITWLQDAKYAQTSGYDADGAFNWSDAQTWANQLTYNGISGWRLPKLTPVNGSAFNYNFSIDGSTDYALNISYPGPGGKSAGFKGNELAYMYYVNLGNVSYVKPDGTPQPSFGLNNVSFVDAGTGQTKSFTNVLGLEGFWTGYPGNSIYTFLLIATKGFNDNGNKGGLMGAWAVHDGDVAPPPPGPPASPLGVALGVTNTTSFTDTTVTPGTVYYYSVVATGPGGSSAPSVQDSGYALTPGSLTGTGVASGATVNLTTVGTLDWAKWPNYIHKSTGGSQISNYVGVNGSQPSSYTNDPRTLSWSDGTPTTSGSDQAGVTVGGTGNGFRISAPADTNTRTLIVYVGGWNSGGKLVAHLSDGSAVDYVDTSYSSTGLYDAVYTLTYRAALAGQQLVVSWTQASGPGTVWLQGAALAGAGVVAAPAAPAGVSASDGTSSTSVAVSWSASANATSYAVYRSTTAGQQGTQVGAATATTSLSDSTVTPGTVYYYSVVATGPGGSSAPSTQDRGFASSSSSSSSSFAALANATSDALYRSATAITLALAGGGALIGSTAFSSATVNITAAGSTDWTKWPNDIHKANGGSQISTFATIGFASVQPYTNDQRTLTWSDGTPTASGSDQAGLFLSGIGTGFRIIAPADTTTRTLYFYVGGAGSSGVFIAHLSDGSAADYVQSTQYITGQYDIVYAITYRAASLGQQLSVSWTQAAGKGNVTLQGAALK